MKRKILLSFAIAICCMPFITNVQAQWENVDSLYGPLPATMHVYRTTTPLDGKPNIAYYCIADLNDRSISFDVDTTRNRRLTPLQFFDKNNKPLLVVNTTFFSFATHQNLNAVIRKGKLVGYNIHSIPGRGKDTLTYRHPYLGAIGISKKRKGDIAWLYTDSSRRYAYAFQSAIPAVRNAVEKLSYDSAKYYASAKQNGGRDIEFKKWKMQTAVAGGPVLVQDFQVKISNNEELKFGGKAIDDRHPRTGMGITGDNKIIIMVIEGRNAGKAEGATLTQEAQLFRDLGCREALNLDGGGSSCMLINGKETIKVSDAGGERAVPAVFLISR